MRHHNMVIFNGQAPQETYSTPLSVFLVPGEKRYNQHMEPVSIEKALGDGLVQKGFFLATAESCTGGLIADRVTNIPGSSKYFLGGMVTYSNQAKMKWLGVKAETLTEHGAVSRATVEEMALGLAHALQDICPPSQLLTIAVSGIAGPDGGTVTKPVGYVWIAWSFNTLLRAKSFQFQGERIAIKNQSADQALHGALQWLQEWTR
jgi:nicotinamide-nucleotide amidase